MKKYTVPLLSLAAFLTAIPVWCLLARASSTPPTSTTTPQASCGEEPIPPAGESLALTGGRDIVVVASPTSRTTEELAPVSNAIVGESGVDAQDPEVALLLKELHSLRVELEICRSQPDTVEGALVRLPEYAALTPQSLRSIRATLDELPVRLMPGEASWLAERFQLDDWDTFGGMMATEIIIRHLGPARVAAEIPPAKLDWMRQFYEPTEWAALFGDR